VIDFLAANWVWIAVIVLFVAMHRGGHGCGMHGSHGGHAGHPQGDHGHPDQKRPAEQTDTDWRAT
jgi:hypothetical protein